MKAWIAGQARNDKVAVMPDPGSESGAGPIRHPWIAGQARNDKVRVHLQFFFFFQRRSPRTPASFMPR
jgi:hypothetical protein